MMPNCQATGKAQMALTAHITRIVLIALGSCDIVCDLRGWQMATYRSIVNAVMVSIDAFIDVSEDRPLTTQKNSPKM